MVHSYELPLHYSEAVSKITPLSDHSLSDTTLYIMRSQLRSWTLGILIILHRSLKLRAWKRLHWQRFMAEIIVSSPGTNRVVLQIA